MTERRFTKLPFPGFYESLYNSEFDHQTEQAAEWQAEEYPGLAEWINESFWEFESYTAENQEPICKMHVDAFNEKFRELVGVDLKLEFESMTSPRYYNFETDRVFAYFDESAMAEVFAKVKDSEMFAEIVRERFTSYDGFHSHYSNDIDIWREKEFADLDHNELETVINAAVALAISEGDPSFCTVRDFTNAVEMEVLEYGSGNGYFDCVDWAKFDAAREEKLAELEAEQMETEGLEWFQLPIRCDRTPDLFAP